MEEIDVKNDNPPIAKDEILSQEDSILKTNETKALPELDEENILNTEHGQEKEIQDGYTSLFDFIEDETADDEINASLDPIAFSQSPTVSRDAFKTLSLEDPNLLEFCGHL